MRLPDGPTQVDSPMFKEYAKQVKANAKSLADTLMSKGHRDSKDLRPGDVALDYACGPGAKFRIVCTVFEYGSPGTSLPATAQTITCCSGTCDLAATRRLGE